MSSFNTGFDLANPQRFPFRQAQQSPFGQAQQSPFGQAPNLPLKKPFFWGITSSHNQQQNSWVNTPPVEPLKSTTQLGYLDPSRNVANTPHSEVDPELLCSICQNILWKPITCSTCENSFCAGCIRTWINKDNQLQAENCPFRCTFREKRPPPILTTFLSKLQIYCAYAPNGCDKIVPYESLERHEETCPCEKTPCRLCQTPVSLRDPNKKHDIRQCFKQMYDRNPDHVQTQFIKLLDLVEDSQRRIQALEKLLGVPAEEKQ